MYDGHNHPPDPMASERLRLYDRLTTLAMSKPIETPTMDIVELAMMSVPSVARPLLPTAGAMAKKVHYVKQSMLKRQGQEAEIQ